jgi:uncharacterized protein
MRAVFDTDVFVSAFIVPGSQGDRALTLAREGRVELHTSAPILTETAGRLRMKFAQEAEDIKAALKQISRAARIAKPSRRITAIADRADNRILECAVEARADLLVTEDRHLLKMKQFESIPSLADFLRLFPTIGQAHP